MLYTKALLFIHSLHNSLHSLIPNSHSFPSIPHPLWQPQVGSLCLWASFCFVGNFIGLPWWLRWWRVCLQCGRPGFDPWVGKIPWRRKWQTTLVFLPGKSHGWRSLAGYHPQATKSRTQLSNFTSYLCWMLDSTYKRYHMVSFFLFLTYLVWESLGPPMRLQMALFPFYGWVIFHCIYVLHLFNPFIHWWGFRWFPCLGYCEECCYVSGAILELRAWKKVYFPWRTGIYFHSYNENCVSGYVILSSMIERKFRAKSPYRGYMMP